jgi:hypothetical protein
LRRRLIRCAFLGLALFTFGAVAGPAAEPVAVPLPEWMCGHWVMERGERTVSETWLDARGGTLFGLGRTLRGDRLVEFEFLRIERRGDSLAYVAQPNGRPPTEFRLVERTERSVRFENRAHDFPQVVRYWSEQPESLMAEASGPMGGGERKLRFAYGRRPFDAGAAPKR